MDQQPVNEKDIDTSNEVIPKDRSLLYMGIILGSIILIMGYLALFVDDPSKLFKSKPEPTTVVADQSSLLDKSESMDDEQVRSSLVKFIEAFYYDQRRGYFDPPSYFADITETFYNYHNLTHQRLKEIYWKRFEEIRGFKRSWIVSTLNFKRVDSRITATYWVKESYFKPSINEDYAAQVQYELIINEMGKIVSLREADVRNVEVHSHIADSALLNSSAGNTSSLNPTTNPTSTDADKLYDFSLVESAPEYSGGQKEFAKYVSVNLKYPPLAKQNNVQGKVYLSFIVEKDGQLTDVKVKQGLGSGCDEEALRLLRSSPKWKPGLVAGTAVKTYFVLPIMFQL